MLERQISDFATRFIAEADRTKFGRNDAGIYGATSFLAGKEISQLILQDNSVPSNGDIGKIQVFRLGLVVVNLGEGCPRVVKAALQLARHRITQGNTSIFPPNAPINLQLALLGWATYGDFTVQGVLAHIESETIQQGFLHGQTPELKQGITNDIASMAASAYGLEDCPNEILLLLR
jgi:hypothetical protein